MVRFINTSIERELIWIKWFYWWIFVSQFSWNIFGRKESIKLHFILKLKWIQWDILAYNSGFSFGSVDARRFCTTKKKYCKTIVLQHSTRCHTICLRIRKWNITANIICQNCWIFFIFEITQSVNESKIGWVSLTFWNVARMHRTLKHPYM